MTDVESIAPCCKCLERDVYRNAAYVPELENFVRLRFVVRLASTCHCQRVFACRYSAEWKERDKEAKKAEAKRKTLLQRQRRKLEEAGGLIYPFQVLW